MVSFVNRIIDCAQMELSELEQLPVKMVREQASLAFPLQAAISMCGFIFSSVYKIGIDILSFWQTNMEMSL